MSQETPRPNFMFARDPAAGGLFAEPARLRIALFSFSGLLAALGAWTLSTAILTSRPIELSFDRQGAAAAAAHRSGAQWAAWIGLVRGDLYAQAAFANAEAMFLDRAAANAAAGLAQTRHARDNALAAVSLAPVDGATWLLLAALPQTERRPDGRSADAGRAAALLVSYFTAPNDPTLARTRLERALAMKIPLDHDLQEFMKGDLRAILADPKAQAALVAAYHTAIPQNQTLLDAIAAEVDSDFARSLRPEPPK